MQSKIRWGILGTANIAIKRFSPGVRASSNGVVSAIAAREVARAEAIAAQLEIPRAYGSYEALLADPEIDAVYIPLPNAMHAQWTIAAGAVGDVRAVRAAFMFALEPVVAGHRSVSSASRSLCRRAAVSSCGADPTERCSSKYARDRCAEKLRASRRLTRPRRYVRVTFIA